MMPVREAHDESEVSRLLAAWAAGDEGAFEQLAPLVYGQLRQIARRQLRAAANQSIQPTALVHDLYLRMQRVGGLRVEDRSHFFAVAAQMMRRMVIDAARARIARKRQGAWIRVDLNSELPVSRRDRDMIALDDALSALAKLDPRKARIVEMRYFTGLEIAETAALIGVSEGTVRRDWHMAKAWLAREIAGR
jgi:RNA polymerase sigma factor (TIGR02999 family)